MAEVYCGSEPCPLFLNSTCVFYTGESLLYIGVQTNDTLEAIIVKINQAFQNTGIGYAFTNGVIQPTPSQPVQLGGALIQNTTIGGNFTLTFSGNVQAAKHITTGGSSSQFVKGDGTLDSTAYQPAANYITGLSGDVLASGPGVAAATLATVNFSSGTFGNGNTIPIVTVNSKGLVTNITPTPINLPPISLTFIGDVVGSGLTGSNITLLLQNVNPNPYNTITPLKFSVNGKGLVTSASPITASDIVNILGYYPGSAGTSGTSGTSGIDGTFLGSSGTSGTSGSSATSGTSGTSGSSGTSGTSGTTGTSGSSGTTGTSGSSGTTGTSGSSGTSGTTGTSGSSGTSGTTGTSGSSGLSGDRFKTTSTTTYTLQAPGNPGTITVDPGLAYTVAQSIIIAFDANNHNEAEVTSYNSITGVINFVTFTLTGSGTYSSWFINIDGASGGDGTSGTSGTTGTSGTSGTSGTTGTSGSSGTSGTTGTSGSSGTSGTSATNGTGGTSGTSGSSGTSGTTGTSGTSATSGTSGTSGVTGLTALNGLTAQVQNFATGTSGTDFGISSSVSTHTFNLPDASTSARGVVTTGTQTFAGYKIFTGTISANNDIQLAAAGTASTTFIKNISGAGLTSIGSNGFGFNNSDNIYFSGSNKGGGIIAFSNTGNRTYTLPDASGTLAFTSQIPANPVGGTGAAGRVAYWNGAGTITSDSLFQWNDFSKRLGIGRTPTVSLDVEGAGFFSGTLGVGNRITLSTNDQSTNRLTITNSGAGGRSYSIVGGLNGANNSGFSIYDETAGSTRFDINSSGTATFSGSIVGTGGVMSLQKNGSGTVGSGPYYTLYNAATTDGILFQLNASNNIDFWGLTSNSFTASPVITFTRTGAATFSSSVTAASLNVRGSSPQVQIGISGGSYVEISDNQLSAKTSAGAASNLFLNVSGANTILNRDSGNVGIGVTPSAWDSSIFRGLQIGTSNPAFFVGRTDAVSQMQIGVNAYFDGTWKHFATNAASRYYQNGGEHYWDSAVSASANSTVAWVERMRITSGGSVIVVNTVTSNTAFSLQAAGQNGVSDGPYFRYLNTTNSFQILKQINTNTDEDTWSIRGGAWTKIGTLSGTTGAYTPLSDINKKKDFEDSTIGLNAILGLKPTLYRMIDDESEGEKELGFVAQEVKEFIPQAYVENGDDDYQFVGLNYNAIVAALVKSVQELKTEIDSLKNQMQ